MCGSNNVTSTKELQEKTRTLGEALCYFQKINETKSRQDIMITQIVIESLFDVFKISGFDDQELQMTRNVEDAQELEEKLYSCADTYDCKVISQVVADIFE